jgi:hypothetical protein
MEVSEHDTLEHLLVYSGAYKVVICKQCKFAIQPNGIPRHLKERHHLYRARRQRLVDWVNGLTLLVPEQISPPPPTQFPFRHLRLEHGLACNSPDCRHLCVSVKRMKQHWSTSHGRSGSPLEDWRKVKLQTFFRGNCSRYFVVGADTEGPKGSPLDPMTAEDGAFDLLEPSESSPSTEHDGIEINIEHIKLFKHYSAFTNFTLYHRGEPTDFWNDTAVEVSFQYPYLLHGLLSVSALHLAYLRKEQKESYVLIARHHQDVALPQFRGDLQNITDENCHAVLIFSRLQAVYTLASIRLLGLSLALMSPHSNDPLETWLRLFRGKTTLWSTTMSSIKHGPAACLMSQSVITETTNCSDRRIQQLYREIQTMYQGTEDSNELRTCLDATNSFGQALLHISGSGDPARFWEAIEYWVCGLSDLYLHMTAMRQPAALILFAHACILLKHLESFWFVGNHATQLLGLIRDQLSPLYRDLILWPAREIDARVRSPCS